MGYESVGWNEMVHNRIQWWAFVSLQVP